MGDNHSKLETLAIASSADTSPSSGAADQAAAPRVSGSPCSAESPPGIGLRSLTDGAQPNGVGVSSHGGSSMDGSEKPGGFAKKVELLVEKEIRTASTVVLDSNGRVQVAKTLVEESEVQEVRVPAVNGKAEEDDKDLMPSGEGDADGRTVDGHTSPNPRDPSTKADASNKNEVAGEEVEEDGAEEDESEGLEKEFFAGDFVWGKIKSHPWWPGQVYDPSNASESARRLQRRDRHLVAYFGDGTFAWCYPFQMKAFQEEFAKLSSQSSSRSFINAVEKALEEFGRCVESEMTCYCLDARPKLVKPYTMNAGIREGVTVPDGRINNYWVSAFEPVNLVSELTDFARGAPVTSSLELTVLKSRLSAFCFAKGYGDLPQYYDPPAEGISDEEENGSVSEKAEVDGQIDNPKSSHLEGESKVSGRSSARATERLLLKRPDVTEDKLLQRKKQRSMADLMAENVGHEDASKLDSSSKPKKKKANLHVSLPSEGKGKETDKSASPLSKKQTKENHLVTPMTVEEEKPSEDESEEGEAEEGLILSSPRQRKKSKYLSPPYTMLGVRSVNVRKNDEGTEAEAATTPKSGTDSKVANQLIGSPSEASKNTEPQEKALSSSSPRTPKGKKKGVVVAVETEEHHDMPAGELLSDLNAAAVNPMLVKASDSSDSIKAFFEKFRNSSYRGGSQIKTCNVKHLGQKTSDDSTELISVAHEDVGLPRDASDGTRKAAQKAVRKGSDSIETNKSGGGSGPKKRKPKDGARAELPRRKSRAGSSEKGGPLLGHAGADPNGETNRKEATQEGQAALLLTFSPGSSHPSREDLVKVFGEFGELKEAETEVMKESDCARVVFMKAADAERAFNGSDKISLFGHSVVSYRLRYLSSASKASATEAKSQPAVGGGGGTGGASRAPLPSPVSATARTPLFFIKKNLENMMSTLTEPGSAELLSPEVRTNLVGEISGLLKKVTRMVDSTS